MLRGLIVFLALFLASCTGGPREVIKDHNARSVVYGWIDIKDVAGNRLLNVSFRQYSPPSKFPYRYASVKKFAGGYAFVMTGAPVGAFKINTVSTMGCLGVFCGNTINEYNFGSQGGGLGALTVRQPGAHFIGNIKLTKVRTGFFQPGAFSFQRARKAPARKQLLKFVIDNMDVENSIYKQKMIHAYNRM